MKLQFRTSEKNLKKNIVTTLCLSVVFTLGCGLSLSSNTGLGNILKVVGVAATGAALSNKQIQLLDADFKVLETVQTDSQGRFSMPRPKSGQLLYLRTNSLLSVVANSEDNQEEVVHVNPITTVATNQMLRLPKTQRSAAVFQAKGTEVIRSVLGNRISFDKFASDPKFAAASEDNEQAKPSAADLVLDVLAERSNSDSGEVSELISTRLNSDATCKQKSLLEDDAVSVALSTYLAERGISAAEMATELGEDQAVFGKVSDKMVGLFESFETKLNSLEKSQQKIAKKAYRRALMSSIQSQRADKSLCATSSLDLSQIENVKENFSKIVEDDIIEVATRSTVNTQDETKASFVAINTALQSASVVQQINITSTLSEVQIVSARQFVSEVATFTETNLVQEVISSTQTSRISTNLKQMLGTRTHAVLQKVVEDEQLKTSARSELPSTSELIAVRDDIFEDELSTLKPSLPPESISLNILQVKGRTITANLILEPAEVDEDLTHYSLFWGTSPFTRISNFPAIVSLSKSDSSIETTLGPNLPVPSGASHILAYSMNETEVGLDAQAATISKPIANLRHQLTNGGRAGALQVLKSSDYTIRTTATQGN